MIDFFRGARLDREWRTVAAMIAIFCRDRHASSERLYAKCAELESYTRLRLQKSLRRGGADLREPPEPAQPS